MSNTSTIRLSGRVDSGHAAELEKEIDETLKDYAGETIVIDASELDYISSAGLRVLMKIRKRTEKPVEITGVSPDVYDIFEMTGFIEILEVKKRLRIVSVEGCSIVGEGFFSTVYRLDDETIVKLYNTPGSESLGMIEDGRKRARTAFVKGIPTAISYDIVRCGDRYGTVFELLDAKTMNEILLADLSRADELVRAYAHFLKTVHGTEMDAGMLPRAVDIYMGYLEVAKQYLSDQCYNKMKELFEVMPDNHHTVHGDCHMKNIMWTAEGPMLIDMDTLSSGDPVFDFGAIYCDYRHFSEDDPADTMKFFGIEDDMARFIWDKLLEYYLDTRDEALLAATLDKIRTVSAVRMLFFIATTDQGSEELVEKRLKHTVADLEELVSKVDHLTLIGTEIPE